MIVNPAKSLFAKDSCYIQGGGYFIPFDVITSERHRMESDLATHSVDGDSEIVTHIHNKLRSGEFEGIISNWSINRKLFIYNTALLASNASEYQAGVSSINQAQNTYKILSDLHDKRTLVTIVVGLESYGNVAITSIEAGRNKDSGDAQSFSIRFQQVRIVTLKKRALEARGYSVNDPEADSKASIGQTTGTVQ